MSKDKNKQPSIKVSNNASDSADSKDFKDEVAPLDTTTDSKGKSGLADLNSTAFDIANSTKDDSKRESPKKDSNHKGDFKQHKGPNNRQHNKHGHDHHDSGAKSEPKSNTGNSANKVTIEPDKTVNEDLGVVFTKRVDRTIEEYVKPTTDDLFKLGLTNAALGTSWQLFTDLRQLARNFHYSDRFGFSHELNQVVDNILKVKWTQAPFNVGAAKNFDAAYSQPWRSPLQRLYELNNGIANYYINQDQVDGMPWRQPGAVNSFYPYSSIPGTIGGSLPYTPSQVDDIMLFSLDGGAFLKGTNQLIQMPRPSDWVSNYDCYILPGIPGFNHYPDNPGLGHNEHNASEAINDGRLEASHADPGRFIDRQFIYAGDNFTAAHRGLAELGNILGADHTADNVARFHYAYNDNWAQDLIGNLTHREVNRPFDVRNPMTYPDYNYAVIQNDFAKLYKSHLNHTLVALPTALNGQLCGLRDEQAFDNAVQSGIHLGTFLRIMLYAISKTYGYSAFTKAKLGNLSYNDMLPRSVNLARFNAMWETLEFVKTQVLPFIPYNKYSVENFKVWFEATPIDKSKDVFDENNPVFGVRGIFCGMIPYERYSVLSHTTATELESNYFPRAYTAHSIAGAITSALHGFVGNQWGYYVKSLTTQIPIFVPHGDALANFFTYFNCLFIHRPWTRQNDFDIHGLTAANNHSSLTAIVDPLNMTGFAANFFTQPRFNAEMKRWLQAYVELVKPFYAYIQSISDNSATIHFSSEVDYQKPEYMKASLLVPEYKQHIIDWMQNSTRLTFANTLTRQNNTDADIHQYLHPARTVAVVTPHMPTLAFTATRNEDANLFGLANYPLPRVSMPISRNDSFLDFGTFGTIMYNASTPWATSARRYTAGIGADVAEHLNIDADIEGQLADSQSSQYLSGSDLHEPFDLYQYMWYPTMFHMPYYPHARSSIIPAYERPLLRNANNQIVHPNATDFNGGSQIPDYEASAIIGEKFQTMRNFAYDYPADARNGLIPEREYHELFYGVSGQNALDEHGLPIANQLYTSPATSCMRLSFGSGNLNLVLLDQYAVPNISGSDTQSVLSTRQNTVSIFTAFNARAIGMSTTRRNITYSAALDGHQLYREVITENLCKTLGVTYLPFVYVSAGASLFFDQLFSNMPCVKYELQSSDIDLSVKFGNLAALLAKLRTGLFDGEAYPSSDGWGTDQITHPDKLNESKFYNEKQDKDMATNIDKMSK